MSNKETVMTAIVMENLNTGDNCKVIIDNSGFMRVFKFDSERSLRRIFDIFDIKEPPSHPTEPSGVRGTKEWIEGTEKKTITYYRYYFEKDTIKNTLFTTFWSTRDWGDFNLNHYRLIKTEEREFEMDDD